MAGVGGGGHVLNLVSVPTIWSPQAISTPPTTPVCPMSRVGGGGGWETEARRPPATSPGGGGSPVLIFRSHPHVAFDASYLPSRPVSPSIK